MTGSATTLRSEDYDEVAYELRFEGVGTSFVTNEHLADGTWVTDRATIKPLLHPPKYSYGTNFRSSKFETTTTTFEIAEDEDNTLLDLFAGVRTDVEDLVTTIEAGTTAVADNTLWSKHIGLEFIGSAGERMQYPAIPGWTVGPRHVGKFDAYNAEVAIPVTAKPKLWAGRRVVLLRVFHDRPTSGNTMAGSTWTSATNSEVVWWGTMLDVGMVRGKGWKIKCAGPESWLERPLGSGAWVTPIAVEPVMEYLDNEDLFGGFTAYHDIVAAHWPNTAHFGEDQFTTQASSGSLANVRTAFNTLITNIETATGDSGFEFNDEGNASITFDQNQHDVRIKVTGFAASSTAAAVAVAYAHRKSWTRLGYIFADWDDPAYGQNKLPHDDPKYINATPCKDGIARFPDGSEENTLGEKINVPTDDYWAVEFSTNPGSNHNPSDGGGPHNENYNPEGRDNDGNDTYWYPEYPGGVGAIHPGGKQEVLLGYDAVYIEPQKFRAPMSDPDDATAGYTIGGGVGVVDSQGLFLIYGPRRMENTEEEFIEAQVFVGSWKDDSGKVTVDSDGRARIVIERFLDPRLYGLDRDKISSDWAMRENDAETDPVSIVPLNHFGKFINQNNSSVSVLLTMLLTTGTGTGHSSFADDDADTLDVGDNEPGGASSERDFESAAWGLAIPKELVAADADWYEAFDAVGDELKRTKMISRLPISASEIASGIMSPLGLCWHLRSGKYGIFDPWRIVSPDDVDVTITSEAYSADADRPASAIPSQELRVFAPIDRLEYTSSYDPLEEALTYEDALASTDDGVRYRTNRVTHKVDAPGFRKKTTKPWGWETQLYDRWTGDGGGFRWWSRKHFRIRRQKIQRLKAQDCWPGARVLLTDQWVVHPDGSAYGVTNFTGFVGNVSYDCAIEEASVDFIIQDDAAFGFHFYAPMARVFHYDSTNFVLYCYDDMYETGYASTRTDVAWFAEPSWSSTGGSLDVELLQYDGATWTGGIYGTVSSVNDVEGAASITLSGALTGATFYWDKDTIVVPREYSNQGAAWAKALFAGIADEDGLVNGSTANAVKFNGL